jgi:hypothetical protein
MFKNKLIFLQKFHSLFFCKTILKINKIFNYHFIINKRSIFRLIKPSNKNQTSDVYFFLFNKNNYRT